LRRSLHGEHVEHVVAAAGNVHWITDHRWKYVWRSGDAASSSSS
jgi:hypothetical protein